MSAKSLDIDIRATCLRTRPSPNNSPATVRPSKSNSPHVFILIRYSCQGLTASVTNAQCTIHTQYCLCTEQILFLRHLPIQSPSPSKVALEPSAPNLVAPSFDHRITSSHTHLSHSVSIPIPIFLYVYFFWSRHISNPSIFSSIHLAYCVIITSPPPRIYLYQSQLYAIMHCQYSVINTTL